MLEGEQQEFDEKICPVESGAAENDFPYVYKGN